MNSGKLAALAAAFFIAVPAGRAQAQENSAKRLASIVSVAVEEYGKAVDGNGRLISQDEFDETSGFLADAKVVAQRLKGYNAPATQAVLDTIIDAVHRKLPLAQIKLLHARFNGALGEAGAMDL